MMSSTEVNGGQTLLGCGALSLGEEFITLWRIVMTIRDLSHKITRSTLVGKADMNKYEHIHLRNHFMFVKHPLKFQREKNIENSYIVEYLSACAKCSSYGIKLLRHRDVWTVTFKSTTDITVWTDTLLSNSANNIRKIFSNVEHSYRLKIVLSVPFLYNYELWAVLNINPLNTKRRLFYLKTQFVPRSKHFSSRL